MKNKYLITLIIILSLTMIFNSCSQEDEPILNETFVKNTRGWIEETSDYHSMYFDNGKYYVESRDTSSGIYRTSTGSLDKSFLYGLPVNYEIESKFQFEKHDFDDAYCGLLLNGASYEYSFNFYNTGIVEVLEYNRNSRMEYRILADTSDYKFDKEIHVKISVDSIGFRLFVEDYEIGKSEFSVKSWQDLRLFTSKQSKIAVDYITIKEIKQKKQVKD